MIVATLVEPSQMIIEYLADHPEAFPLLAEWQHKEWGYIRPGDSAQKRMARLQGWANHDRIPLTVVAFEADVLLGSASLIPHDMDTRMELTPWMAGVFVGEAYRRKGIGAKLVRRVMAEAGKLNVPLLYLYTVHSEKFYEELGWTLLEHTSYREQPVAIMTCVPSRSEE